MPPIICVGAIYIDTILTVPHFPEEDKKLRASKHTRRRGGNCANTLEVIQQFLRPEESFRSPLHLISVLPARTSEAVRFIQASLPNVQLDTASIFREDASEAASSYIIVNAPSGTRTIVSYNELAEMTLEEFVAQTNIVLDRERAPAGWFHFEGRIPEVTVPCVHWARGQTNYKISVELEKPERKDMEQAAKVADVVFYSKIWAEHHGHTSPKDFLENQLGKTRANALLCCTWGSEGALAVQKSPGGALSWSHAQAWRPEDGQVAVDTIGAGDTFIAGMLYVLSSHESWSLDKKLTFATELASRKVFQEGFQGLDQVMTGNLI